MTEIADNSLIFHTTAEGFHAHDFHVREIEGFQALSTPYEFHITMQCNIEGGVSPDGARDLLSSTAQIGMGPGGVDVVSGWLREIEQLEISNDGRVSLYRAVLVPRFWLTNLTRRSRCWMETSIPDIFKAIFTEMHWADGTDFELRLDESYASREYVTQYEETDFAFLSRWMERLGLYYWFEQSATKEKLVIADANSAFVTAPDNATCTYTDREEARAVGMVHRLRRVNRVRPGVIHVRDYNWRTPGAMIVGDADIDTEHGSGMQVFVGDHFKDNGEAGDYAQVRAEGFLAAEEIYSGSTGNLDFAPGIRFTLSGAPVGDLDQEYVLTRVVVHCQQDSAGAGTGSYSNEFEAIPFDTQYRAPRVTPWPRIDGVIYAKIDAESISSAAPIDDQGRYRVVVPFDIYAQYGGRASRWVRKAEPYAGPGHGMHMTLHAGCDVILAHVGGDPDRPIIVGSLPNPSMGSPLTAAHATRSAIRTRSGILIDFEDDA